VQPGELVAALTRAQQRVGRDGGALAVGISSVVPDLGRLPDAYAEASAAVERLRRLITTLRAYAEADGNIKVAAAQLFVHPNTARSGWPRSRSARGSTCAVTRTCRSS
jgi:DNA-binding PucR family transcriptional regulator